MLNKIIIVSALIASPAMAYEIEKPASWLNIDESYVEYRKFQDYRNPYIPEEKNWDFMGNFHNTYSLFKVIYWDTDLHLAANHSQVLYGGLEYRLGIHITDNLDVFKYHASDHIFDHTETNKFPVQDSYGIRVYFKK